MSLLIALARSGYVPSWKKLPAFTLYLFSALLRAPLKACQSRAERSQEIKAPVFILGHWRSGTTHLYNALVQTEQFAYTPPSASGLPREFPTIERHLKQLLRKAMTGTRLIDNVPVHENAPQEDEIGMANMSLLSYYHAIYFPKTFESHFNKAVFFDRISPQSIQTWESEWVAYLKRILHFFSGNRRLLIKNPVYTARPDQIAHLFPDAHFIHIYRHPVEVFYSMRHFYKKLIPALSLQEERPSDIDEHILSTYSRMMDQYLNFRSRVPSEKLTEFSYESLCEEPLAQLERIHNRADLKRFDEVESAYTNYLSSIQNYRKNRYEKDDKTVNTVSHRLSKYMNAFGYSTD